MSMSRGCLEQYFFPWSLTWRGRKWTLMVLTSPSSSGSALAIRASLHESDPNDFSYLRSPISPTLRFLTACFHLDLGTKSGKTCAIHLRLHSAMIRA